MKPSKILIYDGSFNGFLTAVFMAFEEKINVVDICKSSRNQSDLFSETQTIFTEIDKARRVWNGIDRKSHSAIRTLYFAFLSETRGVEMLVYRYIRKFFASDMSIVQNFSDEVVMKVNQLAKIVGREKHRMEAFVRFQLTKDQVFFANIEPDFDVLPLISKHFRSRYADQDWIIYDIRRKYGLFYQGQGVEIITLDLKEAYTNSLLQRDTLSGEEYDYQELWGNYFKSTSIKSRINKKLHVRHVPRRYWKYLSEKKAV